jgi:hypothetical protein
MATWGTDQLIQVCIGLEPFTDPQWHTKLTFQRMFQPIDIPLFLETLRRDEFVDDHIDHFFADTGYRVANVVSVHQFVPLLIYDTPLIAGHIVIFEQRLAGVEVMGFNLALRSLDLPSQQIALYCFSFAHSNPGQHRLGALRVAENTHQIVFHRQVETA